MPTKADTIVITDDNISEMPISFSRDILSALNAQYNNPTAIPTVVIETARLLVAGVMVKKRHKSDNIG